MIYQIKPVLGNKVKKSLINYIKKDNWITEHKITENFEMIFGQKFQWLVALKISGVWGFGFEILGFTKRIPGGN